MRCHKTCASMRCALQFHVAQICPQRDAGTLKGRTQALGAPAASPIGREKLFTPTVQTLVGALCKYGIYYGLLLRRVCAWVPCCRRCRLRPTDIGYGPEMPAHRMDSSIRSRTKLQPPMLKCSSWHHTTEAFLYFASSLANNSVGNGSIAQASEAQHLSYQLLQLEDRSTPSRCTPLPDVPRWD